jgi:hypothetical protein
MRRQRRKRPKRMRDKLRTLRNYESRITLATARTKT